MPSPANLQQHIRDALKAVLVDWNYRPAPSHVCCTRCCVCGDCVKLGTPGEVCFDDTATLPIHEECHRTKEGMSSTACRLSHAFGFGFLVRFAMEGKSEGWKAKFFKGFIASEGSTAGNRLIGHGVEWWERADGFTDLEQFTRWTRYAYIFEREAPKFEFRGSQVPPWEENKLTWGDYKYQGKKESKRPHGPFYANLPQGKEWRGKTPKCDCKVLARTAGLCGICRYPIDIVAPSRSPFSCNADHIFPDSKGGSDDLVNIQAAHKCCNAGKTSISGGHAPLGWMLGRFALHVMAEDNATNLWKPLYREACKCAKKLPFSF